MFKLTHIWKTVVMPTVKKVTNFVIASIQPGKGGYACIVGMRQSDLLSAPPPSDTDRDRDNALPPSGPLGIRLP